MCLIFKDCYWFGDVSDHYLTLSMIYRYYENFYQWYIDIMKTFINDI